MKFWKFGLAALMLSSSTFVQVAAAQDIIMRRPIPKVLGGADTQTEVDPDENPDNGYEAVYVAGLQCNGDTNKYQVTCFEVLDEGDVPFGPMSNLTACQNQDASATDYAYYAQWMAEGVGQRVVQPGQIAIVDGADCEAEDAPKDYYGISCAPDGDGSFYGRCYKAVASSTPSGQTFVQSLNYIENGAPCMGDEPDGSTQPEYFGIINGLGMILPNPNGNDACSLGMGSDEDSIYLANGTCKTTATYDAFMNLTIITGFQMECSKARPTSGPDGDYQITAAAADKCNNPDNTEEERQVIADRFTPQYHDPVTIDKSCAGVSVLKEPAFERLEQPLNTRVAFGDAAVAKGGAWRVELQGIREEYPFYCHRYDFSIFEGIAVLPGIAEDTRYVEEPNYRDMFTALGVDCGQDAQNAAEDIRLMYHDKEAACIDASIDRELEGTNRGELFCSTEVFVDFEDDGSSSRKGVIKVRYVETGEPSYVG